MGIVNVPGGQSYRWNWCHLKRIQGGPTKQLEDASISDETDTADTEIPIHLPYNCIDHKEQPENQQGMLT